MELKPALAPFVFTPDEKHPEVKFRLKPLTEPQVNELLSMPGITQHDEARVGLLYKAGCIALDGGRKIEGIKIDGRDAEWPRDRDVIPYEMVMYAGAKVWGDAVQTEDQTKN